MSFFHWFCTTPATATSYWLFLNPKRGAQHPSFFRSLISMVSATWVRDEHRSRIRFQKKRRAASEWSHGLRWRQSSARPLFLWSNLRRVWCTPSGCQRGRVLRLSEPVRKDGSEVRNMRSTTDCLRHNQLYSAPSHLANSTETNILCKQVKIF